MISRTFPLGVALRLMASASLGVCLSGNANADHPMGFAAAHYQHMSAGSYRGLKSAPSMRWRPHATERSRPAPSVKRENRQDHPSAFRGTYSQLPDRAGARKAVPITRAQGQGQRFRPDDRYDLGGERIEPRSNPGDDAAAARLQSQFRPPRSNDRPSYEELQRATDLQAPYGAPPPPYPMMPGLPGYGGYVPPW